MENAIHYSTDHSSIRVESSIVGSYAVLTITDYGIGIPPEDLPHVTERFYRVNKARSRSDGGSGLGLSIVEQIVKQHKGKLEIKSIVDEGTVVSVMFPLMEEE